MNSTKSLAPILADKMQGKTLAQRKLARKMLKAKWEQAAKNKPKKEA